MSSTEFNVGLIDQKPSSRVLKPPGGGQSNIFAPSEAKQPHARPKYDQQNSSNLNFVMNTTDPNLLVEKISPNSSEPELQSGAGEESSRPSDNGNSNANGNGHSVSNGSNGIDMASGAPLPKYHHYNSTSLW